MNQPAHAGRPLWIEVIRGSDSWTFELGHQNDQPVVVGSGPQSSVKLNDVPPVCFYFERSGDEVMLITGYVPELTFNSQSTQEMHSIGHGGTIQFGKEMLQITVFDTAPPQRASHPTTPDPSEAVTTAQPPDDNLPTAIVENPHLVHEQATVAIERPPIAKEEEITAAIPMPHPADDGNPPVEIDGEPTAIIGSIPDFGEVYPGYDELDDFRENVSGSAQDEAETPDEQTEGIPLEEFAPPKDSVPLTKAASVESTRSSDRPLAQRGKFTPGKTFLKQLQSAEKAARASTSTAPPPVEKTIRPKAKKATPPCHEPSTQRFHSSLPGSRTKRLVPPACPLSNRNRAGRARSRNSSRRKDGSVEEPILVPNEPSTFPRVSDSKGEAMEGWRCHSRS